MEQVMLIVVVGLFGAVILSAGLLALMCLPIGIMIYLMILHPENAVTIGIVGFLITGLIYNLFKDSGEKKKIRKRRRLEREVEYEEEKRAIKDKEHEEKWYGKGE